MSSQMNREAFFANVEREYGKQMREFCEGVPTPGDGEFNEAGVLACARRQSRAMQLKAAQRLASLPFNS